MAIGGRNGGMSLYLEDGVPALRYRNIDRVVTTIRAASRLAGDQAILQLRFMRTPDGADVELLADGLQSFTGSVPGPLPVFLFTSNETFDLGDDTGSAVSDLPRRQVRCEGCIRAASVRIVN